MIRSSILDHFSWKFAYSLLAFYLVFTKKLGISYQVQFRVRYFDNSWLLQENGISMCSNGKNVHVNSIPTSRIETGTPVFTDRCILTTKASVTNPPIPSPARLQCTYGVFLGNFGGWPYGATTAAELQQFLFFTPQGRRSRHRQLLTFR
jgi:hypothetical protein